MPRIKIVESGWEGFNGSFGTAVFEDGIAEVSPVEANHIGATVRIVTLDKDGEEEAPFSVAEVMSKTRHMEAPVVLSLRAQQELLAAEASDEDIKAALEAFEEKTAGLEAEQPEEEDEEEEDEPEERKIYTREELEAVADDSGIRGLREIGDPLNVKATSLTTLIDLILKAQG